MTDILQTLKPNMVLYHDYRSRSFFDLSGNGQNGAPSSTTYFNGKNAISPSTSSYLCSIPRDSSHDVINGAIVAGFYTFNPGDVVWMVTNGATGYFFYFNSNALVLYTNSILSSISYIADGKPHMFSVNMTNNAKPEFFVDDVSIGLGNNVQTAGTSTSSISISRTFTGSFKTTDFAMVLNRNLTPDEYSALYNRLSDIHFPTIPSLRWVDENGDHDGFKTDFGSFESVTARTSGYLENAGLIVGSGSFKVTTELVNNKATKANTCVTSGINYIPTSIFGQTPTQAASGVFDFWIKRSTGSFFQLQFISGSKTIVAPGYRLNFYPTYTQLTKTGVTPLYTTDAVPDNIWTHVEIIMSAPGTFEFCINGIPKFSVIDGTGALTTSTYMVFDMDSGDKIALGSIDGSQSIVKKVI